MASGLTRIWAIFSESRSFTLSWHAGWGLSAFNDYDTIGEYKHYRIPVGQFYTGAFSNLFFANDHDVSSPTGESYFSNIAIYEDAGAAGVDDVGSDGFSGESALSVAVDSRSDLEAFDRAEGESSLGHRVLRQNARVTASSNREVQRVGTDEAIDSLARSRRGGGNEVPSLDDDLFADLSWLDDDASRLR